MFDLKNIACRSIPAVPRLMPVAALWLCAALAACGKPDELPAIAAQTGSLCKAIKDGGYTRQCSANQTDSTVGIVGNTDDDQAARELCAAIANRMKPMGVGLPGQWKLQVFSPYRDDKPLAACPLD
jgi:hypothetical protein